MIILVFDIEYTGIAANPPRGWKKIKRDAYKEGGKYWHKTFARKHFTHAGAKKYGYARRSGEQFPFMSKAFLRSYTGQKWRKHKHTNPLVFTGATRADVMTKWRVQGTRPGGAVVIMNARGLNRRPKGGKINMRAEMERVVPEEIAKMAQHIGAKANKALAELPRRTRRRKRIGGK